MMLREVIKWSCKGWGRRLEAKRAQLQQCCQSSLSVNQVKIIVLTFECDMKTTHVPVILALTPIDRVRDDLVTKIDSGTILKPCMFLNLILV